MGAITVNSPYSGRPVRVREQDIGRAVRDEENRIFYVVPRADGKGYYSAMTRKGSPREEQAYDDMAGKGVTAKVSGAVASAQQVHDATGRRRSHPRGKLVILVLFTIVAALAYLGWRYKDAWTPTPAPPATIPVDPTPTPGTPGSPATPEVPPPPQSAAPPTDTPVAASDTPDVAQLVHMIHRDAAVGYRSYQTPSGLQIIVEQEGPAGAPTAAAGQTVVVHYQGFLAADGSLIADSRRDRYERFPLTREHVIPGLVEAITGMVVGERRTVLVPAALAYGARGIGQLIPPDSDLRYTLELIAVR